MLFINQFANCCVSNYGALKYGFAESDRTTCCALKILPLAYPEPLGLLGTSLLAASTPEAY